MENEKGPCFPCRLAGTSEVSFGSQVVNIEQISGTYLWQQDPHAKKPGLAIPAIDYSYSLNRYATHWS
jgi:hypothetical protein